MKILKYYFMRLRIFLSKIPCEDCHYFFPSEIVDGGEGYCDFSIEEELLVMPNETNCPARKRKKEQSI